MILDQLNKIHDILKSKNSNEVIVVTNNSIIQQSQVEMIKLPEESVNITEEIRNIVKED